MNCLHCKGEKILKNGILKGGGQRFKCIECLKHFTLGGLRGSYSEEFKEIVSDKYCHKKKSARKLAESLGLSTSTIVQRAKSHKIHCKDCH